MSNPQDSGDNLEAFKKFVQSTLGMTNRSAINSPLPQESPQPYPHINRQSMDTMELGKSNSIFPLPPFSHLNIPNYPNHSQFGRMNDQPNFPPPPFISNEIPPQNNSHYQTSPQFLIPHNPPPIMRTSGTLPQDFNQFPGLPVQPQPHPQPHPQLSPPIPSPQFKPQPTAISMESLHQPSNIGFDSTKKSQRRESPGTPLKERNFVYKEDFSKPAKEMAATAITLYSSEYSYHRGSLIAVNKNFISYIVKGNLIRVLGIKSAHRDLLKGHKQGIVDLQFFSDTEDLLASGETDGSIFIWKIISNVDSVQHEIILNIVSKEVSPSIQRIDWHPTNLNIFASAENNGKVYIWDRSKFSTNVVDRDTNGNFFSTNNTTIHDISFSADGNLLAVTDGPNIKVWNVKSSKFEKDFVAHHGQTTYGVLFCGKRKKEGSVKTGLDSLLITGAAMNSEISLWNIRTWECLQTITFQSSQDIIFNNHFALDNTSSFLLVANTKQKNVYALHLNPPTSQVNMIQ